MHTTQSFTERLVTAAAVAALASCARSEDGGATFRLPAQVAALSAADAEHLKATIEIPGLLAESPLTISGDRSEATGTFSVNVDEEAAHPFVVRLTYEPDGDTRAQLGVLHGSVTIQPHEENALVPEGDFDTCGATSEGGACAVAFDLNRNGLSNLEDLVEEIDPFPAPPFIDVSPDDLPFPSGIRLGSFARQVIVVENVTTRPIHVRTTLVDAPGVTLSLYETSFNPENSAQRMLDLGELQPFQEVLIAVSFAPVNAFLTVGDIFVEATDETAVNATHVRQAQRIRLLANADGELQPPPLDFAPAAITAGADLRGFPVEAVETFNSASLYNGLAITSVANEETTAAGIPYTGRTLGAAFLRDGQEVRAEVAADSAFLVEVRPGSKLSLSLSGIESDVDLSAFILDDGDNITADATRNFMMGKADTSPEALELRNTSAATQRVLVALGRVEIPPEEVEGGLSVDEPAPFALSAHATSAPEFTRPPDPVSGVLEGGNRVRLYGRGFQNNASVTFADALAFDCALTDAVDPAVDDQVLECTVPPGSLLVGKNPATIVVANPSVDDGGDGQAATLPEGYEYEPPAPRLDDIVPNVAPTTGSTSLITVEGAFFSGRNGAPEVMFGDVPATQVTLVDSTRLRVLVPAQAEPGVVGVTVRNILDRRADDPAGLVRHSLPSNLRNFRYVDPELPAPTLADLSPARGAVDGGELVTLTGADIQLGASVLFAGEEALDVDYLSSAAITAVAPPSEDLGFVNVEIVNPDGQVAVLDDAFEYFVPSPTVDTVFPDQASTDGGTFIILNGGGYRAGIAVEFVAASGGAVLTSPNVNRVSGTTLLAATPAVSGGGQYSVRVRNLDGQVAVYGGSFQFLAPDGDPPRIDSITPNSGDKDAPPLVTLRGVEFRNPAVLVGATNVTIASSSVVDGEHTITFVPPVATSPGPAVVRLINSDGQSDTSVFTYFTTLGAPPIIDAVSPGSAHRNDLLTLIGRNFDVVADGQQQKLDDGAQLTIGGQIVAPLTASANTLVARVPNLDALLASGASVAVEMKNSDGQSTSAAFTYLVTGNVIPPPVIDGITPDNAPLAGGGTVTLAGSGFHASGVLTVGGVNTSRTVTANTVTFSPAAHAAGLVVVRFTNPNGASDDILFRYEDPEDHGPGGGLGIFDIQPRTLHALVSGDFVDLLGMGLEDVTAAALEDGAGEVVATANIIDSAPNAVRVLLTAPPPEGPVRFRLTFADSSTLLTPGIEARRPLVSASFLTGGAPVQHVMLGEHFNPNHLVGARVVGGTSPTVVPVFNRTEGIVVTGQLPPLAPGVTLALELHYVDPTSGLDVFIQPTDGPTASEPPLGLSLPFGDTLPASQSLSGLVAFASLNGTFSVGAGSPTTFVLEDDGGAVAASGTWQIVGSEVGTAVRLQLGNESLSPGNYRVRLASTTSPQLAATASTADGFVARLRVVDDLRPASVQAGADVRLTGVSFFGDEVLAEDVVSGVVTLVTPGTDCGPEDPGCLLQDDFTFSTGPLGFGTYRICTVPQLAPQVCPGSAPTILVRGCGDGTCNVGEHPETCATDCPVDFCGNHSCEDGFGETSGNCAADCPVGGLLSSCSAIQADDEDAPSGTYEIDLDGPAVGRPAIVAQCDMDFAGGGWTLALASAFNGPDSLSVTSVRSGVPSRLAIEDYMQLAENSTQVHVRRENDPGGRSATSRPGTTPIQNVRNGTGMYLSQAEYRFDDWDGPSAGNMHVFCDPSTSGYPQHIYHACGNSFGLHFIDNVSTFDNQFAEPLEVWMRNAPVPTSCEEFFEEDKTAPDGDRFIDPDGGGPDPGGYVFCERPFELACSIGEQRVTVNGEAPVNIVDLDTRTATATVAAAGVVTRALLHVEQLDHSFLDDLHMELISPAGARAVVFSHHGGSSADVTDMVLADSCGTPLDFGSAPFTGCFAPDEPLFNVEGSPATGAWTLALTDTVLQDQGVLQGWSLQLCVNDGSGHGSVCGDNVCTFPETALSCTDDCSPGPGFCGDEVCGPPESAGSCSHDCPGFCGDGVCVFPEDSEGCGEDCNGEVAIDQ